MTAMLPAQSLRVMSFNIRYHNPADGYNAWPHRKALVESMIRFHRADLLGIQEALQSQMNDLAAMLPDYGYMGRIRDKDGEYAAIFYRKSRLELLQTATFWLSETPQQPSRGWDAALNRVTTWGKFRDKHTGKLFFHFNTHYDHRGERARVQSSHLMLAVIDSLNPQGLPVLVTGDFNMKPASEAYQVLTNPNDPRHLTDAWYHSQLPPHGPAGSWSGFQFPGQPDSRIDYIFTKNRVATLRYGILSDSWSGRFPSDHLPVLAEVLLAPPTPLPRAHAHNDYEHPRPLLDALEQGFTSIEVDVFPVDGELYVAHNLPADPHQLPSLRELYLEPLARLYSRHFGSIYPAYQGPFYLMIDIKRNGSDAYQLLKTQLAEYDYLLRPKGGPVTVFLSGARPLELIQQDPHRLVGIDGRPEDLGKDYPPALMPVVSQRYGKLIGWRGNGEIPEADLQTLTSLVQQAHAEGKKVRLWASPEKEAVWEVLLRAGVDFINTDKLEQLREFLEKGNR